jgi:drug/metabolite transporter (DMT)-like permease
VAWGGGDFSGGMGVKSAGGDTRAALRVVLMSHAMSFAVLLAIARLRGDPFPHGAVLAWGIAGGVAGGLSLTAFYIALSRAAMGASAAVSGLLAAAIPALVGIWQAGSPGKLPVVGFLVAGAAIWLIAAGDPEPETTNNLILATLAGMGFGIYFVALKMANSAGVVWPMATARMGSLTTCSLMALGFWWSGRGSEAEILPKQSLDGAPGDLIPPKRSLGQVPMRVVLWAMSTALLDTSGNMLFLASTRAGRLDVAAVLASLYPASTIGLAALTLGEWPTRRQAVGMITAAAAVVMITI